MIGFYIFWFLTLNVSGLYRCRSTGSFFFLIFFQLEQSRKKHDACLALLATVPHRECATDSAPNSWRTRGKTNKTQHLKMCANCFNRRIKARMNFLAILRTMHCLPWPASLSYLWLFRYVIPPPAKQFFSICSSQLKWNNRKSMITTTTF